MYSSAFYARPVEMHEYTFAHFSVNDNAATAVCIGNTHKPYAVYTDCTVYSVVKYGGRQV